MAHSLLRQMVGLGVGVIFWGLPVWCVGETFPVVHSDPILIRVVDGNSGHPLAHVHLTMSAGYDERDVRLNLWPAEALTDGEGRSRIPSRLSDFPFLRISVTMRRMCQPRTNFSIEEMRRYGLTTPNHCGTVVVERTPGIFTIFARSKPVDLPPEVTTPGSPALPPSDPTPTRAPASERVLRSRQMASNDGAPLSR